MQIIPGISLRLLFADTPPSSSAALTAAQNNPNYPYPYNPHSVRQSSYGQHSQYSPPVRLPGPRKQVIYTSGKSLRSANAWIILTVLRHRQLCLDFARNCITIFHEVCIILVHASTVVDINLVYSDRLCLGFIVSRRSHQ